MSRLEELIQELCPDGVEYKHINDICKSLAKGTLKQDKLKDTYEDRYNIITNKTVSKTR